MTSNRHPQVRCLSLDEAGILLLTGDDSGVLCVRELPRERSINSPGTMLERPKDSAPGRSPVDDHTVIVTGAHDGGVYAVSHVMGSQRRLGLRGGKNVDALFLSGGAGEQGSYTWCTNYCEDVPLGKNSVTILEDIYSSSCHHLYDDISKSKSLREDGVLVSV